MAIKEYKTDNIHINFNIVDSDGSYGTSGQVLSRDAGGVTWVDGSGTVIGGPYLPLVGGTLTGDLTISTATTPLFKLLDTTNNISLLLGADDANTFIRSSSTANLYLQPGGSTSMTLLSGGNVGIGTTSPSVPLAVEGVASMGSNSRLSMGILDINSSGTPTQILIQTTIPFNSGSADFTVNIKGFIYGTDESCNLSIHWHYYNSIPYNANITSSGSWAPIAKLHSSSTGFVQIHLLSPGYWPKIYVESMYSSAYNDLYASGWSWSDAAGTGTAYALDYNKDFGNNFVMTDPGDVGIGTSSPSQKLDVNGAARLRGLLVDSTNNSGTNGYILSKVSAGTQWINPSTLPVLGDYLPLAGGTLTGGLVGTTGNFSGAVNALYFRTAAANTDYNLITRNNTGNALFVQNAQSGTDQNIATFQYGSAAVNAGTTVLQVAKDKSYFANCNVGIGTTSPSSPLTVESSNSVVLKLNPTANNYGGIQFSYAGAVKGISMYNSGFMVFGGESGVTTRLQAGGQYAATILTNGNVGIGTTSPGEKLTVISSTANTWATSIENTAANGTSFGLEIVAGSNNGDKALAVRNKSSSDLMVVRGDGNVGIGTSTPNNILHVSDAGTSTLVRVGNNAAFDAGIYFNTSTDWTIGTDTSNSNAFTIGNGSSVGAAPKVTIATGGNVGIGTTSPSTKLHVDGTVLINASSNNSNSLKVYRGALQTLNLWNATNGAILSLSNDAVTDAITLDSRANQKSYINTGGNFGIGTTNPLNKLFVSASTAGDYAGFIENTNSTNGYGLLARTAHTGASAYAFAARAGASDIFVVRGDGNVGIGTTSPGYKLTVNGDVDVNNGAILAAQAYGMNLGAAGYDILMPTTTRIAIRTGASERISILNTGNVGIGKTNPSAKLDVVGNAVFTSSLQASSFYDGYITWTAAQINRYGSAIELQFAPTNSATEVKIGANGSNPTTFNAYTGEAIFTGNVGIGTTSPSQKLHVSGNARVTGAYYDSTGVAGSPGTAGQVLSSTVTGTDWVTPSSGGGIGGSIASTQIAFGSATADEITGSAEATFLESAGKTLLQVGSTGGKAQTLININQTNNNSSRARLELSKNTLTRGFLGIENASTDVTLYSNDNLVLDSDGDDVIITTQSTSNVGVGNTTPGHKLDVTGRIKASKGLQVGEETSTTANAASEGTIRYRGAISVGSKTVSVVEMCMQVSATPTYAWEAIYTTAGWV